MSAISSQELVFAVLRRTAAETFAADYTNSLLHCLSGHLQVTALSHLWLLPSVHKKSLLTNRGSFPRIISRTFLRLSFKKLFQNPENFLTTLKRKIIPCVMQIKH